MTPDQVQASAAIATFFAALLAVWATFRAPKLAAQFAEQLRTQNSALDENRRLKMVILTTLMENRASILATHSISALNLIDIIFLDSNDVRNARRDFIDAVNSKPFVVTSAVERYYALAHCVARDIGLNDKISIAEIRSVYSPISQGDQAELEHLERQQRLSSLRQSSDRPTGPE